MGLNNNKNNQSDSPSGLYPHYERLQKFLRGQIHHLAPPAELLVAHPEASKQADTFYQKLYVYLYKTHLLDSGELPDSVASATTIEELHEGLLAENNRFHVEYDDAVTAFLAKITAGDGKQQAIVDAFNYPFINLIANTQQDSTNLAALVRELPIDEKRLASHLFNQQFGDLDAQIAALTKIDINGEIIRNITHATQRFDHPEQQQLYITLTYVRYCKPAFTSFDFTDIEQLLRHDKKTANTIIRLVSNNLPKIYDDEAKRDTELKEHQKLHKSVAKLNNDIFHHEHGKTMASVKASVTKVDLKAVSAHATTREAHEQVAKHRSAREAEINNFFTHLTDFEKSYINQHLKKLTQPKNFKHPTDSETLRQVLLKNNEHEGYNCNAAKDILREIESHLFHYTAFPCNRKSFLQQLADDIQLALYSHFASLPNNETWLSRLQMIEYDMNKDVHNIAADRDQFHSMRGKQQLALLNDFLDGLDDTEKALFDNITSTIPDNPAPPPNLGKPLKDSSIMPLANWLLNFAGHPQINNADFEKMLAQFIRGIAGKPSGNELIEKMCLQLLRSNPASFVNVFIAEMPDLTVKINRILKDNWEDYFYHAIEIGDTALLNQLKVVDNEKLEWHLMMGLNQPDRIHLALQTGSKTILTTAPEHITHTTHLIAVAIDIIAKTERANKNHLIRSYSNDLMQLNKHWDKLFIHAVNVGNIELLPLLQELDSNKFHSTISNNFSTLLMTAVENKNIELLAVLHHINPVSLAKDISNQKLNPSFRKCAFNDNTQMLHQLEKSCPNKLKQYFEKFFNKYLEHALEHDHSKMVIFLQELHPEKMKTYVHNNSDAIYLQARQNGHLTGIALLNHYDSKRLIHTLQQEREVELVKIKQLAAKNPQRESPEKLNPNKFKFGRSTLIIENNSSIPLLDKFWSYAEIQSHQCVDIKLLLKPTDIPAVTAMVEYNAEDCFLHAAKYAKASVKWLCEQLDDRLPRETYLSRFFKFNYFDKNTGETKEAKTTLLYATALLPEKIDRPFNSLSESDKKQFHHFHRMLQADERHRYYQTHEYVAPEYIDTKKLFTQVSTLWDELRSYQTIDSQMLDTIQQWLTANDSFSHPHYLPILNWFVTKMTDTPEGAEVNLQLFTGIVLNAPTSIIIACLNLSQGQPIAEKITEIPKTYTQIFNRPNMWEMLFNKALVADDTQLLTLLNLANPEKLNEQITKPLSVISNTNATFIKNRMEGKLNFRLLVDMEEFLAYCEKNSDEERKDNAKRIVKQFKPVAEALSTAEKDPLHIDINDYANLTPAGDNKLSKVQIKQRIDTLRLAVQKKYEEPLINVDCQPLFQLEQFLNYCEAELVTSNPEFINKFIPKAAEITDLFGLNLSNITDLLPGSDLAPAAVKERIAQIRRDAKQLKKGNKITDGAAKNLMTATKCSGKALAWMLNHYSNDQQIQLINTYGLIHIAMKHNNIEGLGILRSKYDDALLTQLLNSVDLNNIDSACKKVFQLWQSSKDDQRKIIIAHFNADQRRQLGLTKNPDEKYYLLSDILAELKAIKFDKKNAQTPYLSNAIDEFCIATTLRYGNDKLICKDTKIYQIAKSMETMLTTISNDDDTIGDSQKLKAINDFTKLSQLHVNETGYAVARYALNVAAWSALFIGATAACTAAACLIAATPVAMLTAAAYLVTYSALQAQIFGGVVLAASSITAGVSYGSEYASKKTAEIVESLDNKETSAAPMQLEVQSKINLLTKATQRFFKSPAQPSKPCHVEAKQAPKSLDELKSAGDVFWFNDSDSSDQAEYFPPERFAY